MRILRLLNVLALTVLAGAQLQAQPAEPPALDGSTNASVPAITSTNVGTAIAPTANDGTTNQPPQLVITNAVSTTIETPGTTSTNANPFAPTNGVATAGTNGAGLGSITNQTAFIPNNVTNTTHSPDELHLNFRGVPLEMVLNYLSEAAGFTIVMEAKPSGRVDVWSNQPLTRAEAVDLLNTVLNHNGFAAIRRGRTLTIINRDEAKIRAIPVKLGSDPEIIPDNDEMVTQIIPVRYVEVTQLIKDIQPLVSVQTAMTANESGNSIVITDTQANIRRIAEVIKAIDMGAEDMTVVRVFKLNYADPSEMADLLTSLFPDESRSGGSSQSPVQFGRMFGGRGGGGGPFGGFGGGGQSTSGSQSQRIKKRARVLAVPDPRTASIIVSAGRDLMDQIEGVVQELDADPRGKKTVKVFPLQNSDPTETLKVLQDIFQKNGTTSSRNSANQSSVLQNRSNQQNQNTTGNRGATSRNSSRSGAGGSMGGFGN